MNVLNMTGLVIVAAAALCTLWGVVGRVDSGRHRRVDAADARALVQLRAQWNAAATPAHAALPHKATVPVDPPARGA
jgi:hypothetical protein